jgi:hypothetical protein
MLISAQAIDPVTRVRDALVVVGVTKTKSATLEAVMEEHAILVSPGFTTIATP